MIATQPDAKLFFLLVCTKVFRRRRVLRLSLGSRRWWVCRRRAIEEECVISWLIRIPVPNPSHIIISWLSTSSYQTALTRCFFTSGMSHHHHPALTPGSPSEPSGCWDSIHVFETMERGRQAHYKLTSTVMLQLITRRGNAADISSDTPAWKHDGEISLSGSMTRQVCCLPSCAAGKPRDVIRMIDGAGSSCAGRDIACAKCRQDGRGYGN